MTKGKMLGCVKLDVTIFFYLHLHVTTHRTLHDVFPCSISRTSSEASFCLIACFLDALILQKVNYLLIISIITYKFYHVTFCYSFFPI